MPHLRRRRTVTPAHANIPEHGVGQTTCKIEQQEDVLLDQWPVYGPDGVHANELHQCQHRLRQCAKMPLNNVRELIVVADELVVGD